MRKRRVLGIVALGGLLLAALAGAFLVFLTTDRGERIVAGFLESRLGDAIAGDPELGSLELDGDTIVLHDIVIRAPDGRRAAWARRARIELSIGALLRTQLRIERLIVDDYGIAIEPAIDAFRSKRTGKPRAHVAIENLELRDGEVRAGAGLIDGLDVTGALTIDDAINAHLGITGRVVEPEEVALSATIHAMGAGGVQHALLDASIGDASVEVVAELPRTDVPLLDRLGARVDIDVPAIDHAGYTYGPIRIVGGIRDGRATLEQARADLPGLELRRDDRAGSGGVAVTLRVADLARALRAAETLLARDLPSIAASGVLRAKLDGPLRTRTVAVTGELDRASIGALTVRDLALAGQVGLEDRASLRLAAADLVIGKRHLRDISLHATRHLGRPGVRVDGLEVTWAANRWHAVRPAHLQFVAGGIDVDHVSLASGDKSLVVDVAWNANARRVDAQLDSVPAATWLDALVPTSIDVQGLTTGELHLTMAPDLQGSLDLRLTDWRAAGFSGPWASGDVRMGPDRVVGVVEAATDGGTVRTRFDVPADSDAPGRQRVELTAKLGDVRAAQLWRTLHDRLPRTLTKAVQRVSGRVSGDLRIRGSWNAPRYDGSLALRRGSVHLRSLPVVRNLTIDVDLAGDRLRVQRLSGRAGPGRVRVEGRATRTAGDGYRYRFDVHTVRFPVPGDNDAFATLDGTVHGRVTDRRITSTLEFETLRVLRPAATVPVVRR